jgi:uncharacterized membrane protein YoaK (UPF0700 family)
MALLLGLAVILHGSEGFGGFAYKVSPGRTNIGTRTGVTRTTRKSSGVIAVRSSTRIAIGVQSTTITNDNIQQEQHQQEVYATKEYRKKRFANSLGFLTGWTDVAAFTQLQTFPTMMSGNTLWMARGFVEGKLVKSVLYSFAVIICYCAGLAIWRNRLTSADQNLRKGSMKFCGTLVAALMVLSQLVASSSFCPKLKLIPVGLLAISYGIINSIGSEVAGTMTFVVTGHITKISHQLTDRLSRRRGNVHVTKSDLTQSGSMLLSFFAGGFVACALQKYAPSFPNFAAIGILHGLLFYFVDMELIGGAWWLRKTKQLCDNLEDDGELCDVPEE